MTALDFDMPPRRSVPWGTAASLGLHLALAVALIVLSPLRQMVVPAPDPVSVEIVTPDQFAALQPKRPAPAPPESVAQPEEPPVITAARPPTPDRLPPSAPLQPDLPQTAMHTATEFFSRSILSEPGMARIRQTFGTLADSEKLIQLCNIEGLEQLRRAAPDTDPDTLVAYAMSDPMSVGLTLTAPGAAFRSRRRWYGVSFTCAVAPDYRGVTAFEFGLGEPIPQELWEEHSLNIEDADE